MMPISAGGGPGQGQGSTPFEGMCVVIPRPSESRSDDDGSGAVLASLWPIHCSPSHESLSQITLQILK